MHEVKISMTVNGRLVERSCEPHLRLLDFVRDELHLTGNKEGCGAGECGTCSMFVDGKLVKTCLTPAAKVQGCRVDTVEGLEGQDGELTVLQKAFHRTGASQCGFCIPGMVMAATSTLRRNPHAGLDEIKEGLGGNICRCTGYQKIFEAVELARDVLNGTLPAASLDEEAAGDSFIGASYRRLDAPQKVSGRLQYAADMAVTNMLHMQVLRSPIPHGRIELLDVSAARAMPGVEAVITCDDIPGKDGFGVFYHDQPVMRSPPSLPRPHTWRVKRSGRSSSSWNRCQACSIPRRRSRRTRRSCTRSIRATCASTPGSARAMWRRASPRQT
jgi:aerobic-type carbon monoxide dehydrogenase small subunit (CoxS/CutS family)